MCKEEEGEIASRDLLRYLVHVHRVALRQSTAPVGVEISLEFFLKNAFSLTTRSRDSTDIMT